MSNIFKIYINNNMYGHLFYDHYLHYFNINYPNIINQIFILDCYKY